jgi:LmbE family N-acetylglucosaminyl deacetylase
MPSALALSPHLDDAVFSCGGLLAALVDAGWDVTLATVFTATKRPVSGFALACQLDKGLSPDVDYMALRRAEDREAAAILGIADLRHLDLLEAPHRGYESAPALFGDVVEDDEMWRAVSARVAPLLDETRPALVLAPQGLGGHVDHRQVIRAVLQVTSAEQVTWYRDTPYAIRSPAAVPDRRLPALPSGRVPLTDAQLSRKIAASCAYASQVGFQFGGASVAAERLRDFAMDEGEGRPAERFLTSSSLRVASLPGVGHSQATL